MRNKRTIQLFLLIIIVCLGFFLRIYRLSEIPTGFFADEASMGYNAYTIMISGKDEHGIPYPIFFRGFGEDYSHPLAIYSTIPFIKILGLTELSVRLQSVLYGIIIIILLYLLGKETISKNFGLWTAFIASTTPWFIHYNRVGFDYNVYVAFFIFSIYLLIKSLQNKHLIIPFFIILGLTFYTYQPAKLLVPFLLIGAVILYRKNFLKYKTKFLYGLFFFIIISLPLILSFIRGEATARFSKVSIFTLNLPPKDIILKSLENYFIQLTPAYLYTTGEPTFITRHFTNGLLPLLIITLPFFILGCFTLLRNIRQKFYQFLFFWLLIYPIAGAVTAEGPFSGRSFIGAPLFTILISIGIATMIRYGRRFVNSLALSALIIAVVLINFAFFAKFYFVQYPLYSSDFWGWQYGPRETLKYFLTVKDSYDDLYMSGEFNGTDIFFKFYDPKNTCQNKCKGSDLWREPRIYNTKRKQLFSLSPEYLEKSTYKKKFNIKKTIYYPNKTIAFLIGEVVK